MINSLRSESKTPLLLVDAGNLLFKRSDPADNPISQITAHGIVRAYKVISYDAVAVAPQDLQAGREFFRMTLDGGFPWVSANVFDEEKHLVFPPSIIVHRPGVPDVGIIGLTGPAGPASSWTRIADWRETLPEQIARLKSTCGMLILLSSLADDENETIAREFPQLALIVTSSPTRYGNRPPASVGNSLITQSDGRGKYLGKLDITYRAQGSWRGNSSIDPLKQLRDRISAIDLQIQKHRETERESNKGSDSRLQAMFDQRKILEEQLASLANKAGGDEQETDLANTFEVLFLPIRPQPSGNEVDTITQDIKKSIDAYQKNRLTQSGKMDTKTAEALQLSQYAGVDTCRSCHEKQSAFWAETAHAKAFTTLVASGQNYNPECLPCHVTGGDISPVSSFARKDLLVVLPEDRQSVGCETCHGPGRQHSLNPENAQPPRQLAEKVCLGCHTPERDDNFDFSTKMMKAACPLNG